MSTPCRLTEKVYGLAWDNTMQIIASDRTLKQEQGIASDILAVPTTTPTFTPSGVPTRTPTVGIQDCFDEGYTHQISDLKFAGIAEAGDRGCRWGLDTNWPGGDTPAMCDSPYVICLPQANTPNVGFPLEDGSFDAYPSDTASYTIEMCKKECAYD